MEHLREKSWFTKNWGWLLGGGCLSIIIVVVIIIAGAAYKIADAVKGSEPYAYAYSKAIENEEVIAALGEPIETNGLGNTKYNHTNGSSTANLIIPIKGQNNEGNITVEAEKINDEWTYNLMYVTLSGETESINLLEIKSEDHLDDF